MNVFNVPVVYCPDDSIDTQLASLFFSAVPVKCRRFSPFIHVSLAACSLVPTRLVI